MDHVAERLKNLTPLQLAVLALKETRARLEALESKQAEPIAIVGMACRFPGGAVDPQSFWQLLCDGVDAIRETPRDRWDVDRYYDPDPAAPGKTCSRWGGYLDQIDAFDNHFFGISDREAMRIDPQQRFLLELTWEALEDAGLPPSSLRGTKTGTFVGISISDYGIMLCGDVGETGAYAVSGTSLCLAANRLAFIFGLQGPSMAVDTACSSSLVAVHLACQNIRNGECEMALAGGTNLLLSPIGEINLAKGGFCSRDGRVRSFDADASGYVRSEGAGLVVLKPLSAAIANRDTIHAVIRGSAVNQNGASNGMTAPSRAAQEQLLREAYSRAKVSPGRIQYVETQGTGTRLGDTIEALALGSVLGEGRAPGSRCAIGAVKTNIGHMETASGIASLMKAALALKHGQLPANLHFRKPNPDIPFDHLPLRILEKLEPWPRADQPRLAGVSAFGFGGSNAHIVLEESPAAADEAPPEDAGVAYLLPLSARTDKALSDLAERYVQFLADDSSSWRDVCYTAAVRRDHHDCRLAVLARSPVETRELLQGYLAGQPSRHVFSGRKPYGRDLKIAFLYSRRAQSRQAFDADFTQRLPGFTAAVEVIDDAVENALGWRLSAAVNDAGKAGDCRHPRSAELALQLALTQWWQRAGVTPDVVFGLGPGELAAACAAGILTTEESLRLAADYDGGGGKPCVPQSRSALLPFISSVDGRTHSGADLAPGHWRQCLRDQANAPSAIEAVVQRQLDFYLRLGGDGPTLAPSIKALDSSLTALGELYAAGVDLTWSAIAPASVRIARLPAYPWQKQRLWIGQSQWKAPQVESKPMEADVSAGRSARPDLNTPFIAPQAGLESELAEIWVEILQVEKIGIHDNFFALGGHSLLAAQVASRIAARVKVDLPLREMFQSPTIAELADRINAAAASGERNCGPPIPRLPRDGEMRPSFTQESLWFLDQLERGRATYTIYTPLRVSGRLNAATLERTFDEIRRRHETLRTRFPEVDGRPILVIEPALPRPLQLVDLSPLSEVQRESRLREWISKETARPIDLQNGPLMRVTLLRLSDNDHVVMVSAHHIIYDGWSVAVLLREVTALYTAFETGQPSPLPELATQHADFAAWQRQWLQGANIERLRSYWVKQLAGVAPIELPLDHPRPSIRSTRGDTKSFDLPPALSEALSKFCREEGVTPFMTLLAVFEVLLGRYTGQADIAVGAPVANRGRPETESLIGYFINVVVLRNDLSGDLSFREVLRRLRQVTLDAYDHQEITLDQVVAAVNPPRDMSRHPLFQVMFALHNFDLPKLDVIGLDMSMMEEAPAAQTAFFDLTLSFRQSGSSFRGELNYSTDLFEGETIGRMIRHYEILLAAALTQPDGRLSSLPLLAEEERKQLLVQGNLFAADDTATACVHEWFDSQARQTPHAPALIDGERRWTYRDLNERANRLGHYLRARGVGPDRIVALRFPRSAELIVAMLGVLKAGGAYLPLDPHLPAERLEFVLEDAAIQVVVTLADLPHAFPPDLPHVVCLDRDAPAIEDCPADQPQSGVAGGHLAYVIYTSGSTGHPKGVLIEHRALAAYTEAAAARYEITAADRVLQFASASFDAHAEEVFPCLANGGTLVLRNDEMLDYRRFLRQCAEWEITFLTLPTAYWHELIADFADNPPNLPESLRMVVIGGERAMPDRVALWFQYVSRCVRLLNTYGPAEATVVATAAELSPADGGAQRVSIGQPLANARAFVLDRNRQLVPAGVHGELYLAGNSLARGYLNRRELTADRFLTEPFSGKPDSRMYRTGDVVRWKADGALEFIGREDNQVKIRGFRIEPGEVEEALGAHPALAQAAVVARERAEGDLRLVAYVVGKAASSMPGASEIKQFVSQRVPDYMVPSVFVALPQLPMTSSGKVDRKALPEPDWGIVLAQGKYVPPKPGVEEQLGEIWSEVLGLDRIGAHDDFFDLGGNSLLALRLVARARAAFSVDLPLVSLFTAPTISGLAAILERISAEPRAGVELSNEPVDWAAETELDPAIKVTGDLKPAEAIPSHVLLTGATGFLGAYLLRELLARTDARIHCLVRAQSDNEAKKRILDNLRQYEIPLPSDVDRVIPVRGELTEPRLGLAREQFDELAVTIDAIYHNGAYVNFLYPYRVLKPANVTGTIEVLRLAATSKVKPLHFVSTISVFEAPEYGPIAAICEDQPLVALASLQGGYAQSKCVAEKLVRAAGERGLPVTIYRPGRVTGDSETGAESLTDYTTLLLRLCIDLMMAPASDNRVDMTPVDYVARAVVGLAKLPESAGRTFHLNNPRPVPIGDVYRAIRAAGFELEEVPVDTWRSRAIRWGADSKDASYMTLAHWMMLMAPAGSSAASLPLSIACDQTQLALRTAGVNCPVVNVERLRKQVQFLVRKKLCSPPPVAPVVRFQSLVPLRTGGNGRPLFCFHGLGGHVVGLVPLARNLSGARPIHGLQALGLQPGQEPQDRIEEMAATYLREIRGIEPEGPYLLGGWSMGGLIALEAAQQLTAIGQEVAVVAMIDSYLSMRDFENDVEDRSAVERVASQLGLPVADIRHLSLDEQWGRIAEAAKHSSVAGIDDIRRLAAVCQGHFHALRHYEVRPYGGSCVLFSAAAGRIAPDRGWRPFCPRLRVEPVCGDHYGMLREPDVLVLAERLDRCLQAHAGECGEVQS